MKLTLRKKPCCYKNHTMMILKNNLQTKKKNYTNKFVDNKDKKIRREVLRKLFYVVFYKKLVGFNELFILFGEKKILLGKKSWKQCNITTNWMISRFFLHRFIGVNFREIHTVKSIIQFHESSWWVVHPRPKPALTKKFVLSIRLNPNSPGLFTLLGRKVDLKEIEASFSSVQFVKSNLVLAIRIIYVVYLCM